MSSIYRMDAGELREFLAQTLASGAISASSGLYLASTSAIGAGIDRLASLTGSLPEVLRCLADDVEALRSEPTFQTERSGQ